MNMNLYPYNFYSLLIAVILVIIFLFLTLKHLASLAKTVQNMQPALENIQKQSTLLQIKQEVLQDRKVIKTINTLKYCFLYWQQSIRLIEMMTSVMASKDTKKHVKRYFRKRIQVYPKYFHRYDKYKNEVSLVFIILIEKLSYLGRS